MAATELERHEDGVALLRMNRPETRNALTADLREELAAHFGALAADGEVRAVVLTGGPKAFAAGADLKAMAEASASEMMLRGLERLWAPIKGFPKPLIAAVEGWALGGGAELAMHADIIVASESAKFGQPEIKVGIMPGAGGTQRLTRAVGKFKAMKILLTGEPFGAAEAEAMGLVSEVVPDGTALDRALELARAIAAMPPIAARKIKETVLAGADQPLDSALLMERQAFQLLFDTADQKEGMRAFLEKRKPSFTGR
ncbi:enoyl-CoA hydratase-related protein [Aurantimonas sp. 22II-16-19i]|uniref:enoyl-CoA hydratase-related protein n=1 Tax=Aurantimonas sp. 22II-16-19i TaxID=1317114 RepID=UPI0009F7E732|nr:enoyl-CoA hydratase-related protein [Aurantimonas sp. 22II-16-19i]ORE97930.1 enoyl-CoA hydratase [Aurantimonas sp. 22II-16-19i]